MFSLATGFFAFSLQGSGVPSCPPKPEMPWER